MNTLKVGTRVRHVNCDFLSDGYIIKVIQRGVAYVVKLDKKAPNEYAWDTDEVLAFPSDIEEIV